MNPEFFYMEDVPEERRLRLFAKGSIEKIDYPFKPYAFAYGDGPTARVDYLHGKPLVRKEFESTDDMGSYSWASPKSYEADVPYERRVMLDLGWQIGEVPKAYVDIETDDSTSSIDMWNNPIISIGIIFGDGRRAFLSGKEPDILRDYAEMMRNVGMVITYNGGTDVWEKRSFDIPYLATRWGKVIEGMGPSSPYLYPFDQKFRYISYVDLFQTYRYETSRIGKSLAGGYSLDNVAQHELGEGKVPRSKKVIELTPDELKEYNMRDVEVLKRLDEKFQFTDMKIGMARLCGTTLTAWRRKKRRDELRPLVLVDQLMLREAARMGIALPTRKFSEHAKIVGATVLTPKIGVHHNVQNYDVRQMYPSIMINEKVSPDKDRALVPNILKGLMARRAELKAKYAKTGATEDYIMQYNYKVLSNVFYGAFGNPACRVFDASYAGYITAKGRKILEGIKDHCESAGYEVVYGDTDSVFVKLNGKEEVPYLENLINIKMGKYEVEAGEFYESIMFMGNEFGAKKKRYAGLHSGNMKLAGVESVRRDYCPLARQTQTKVFRMLLEGKSVKEVREELESARRSIYSGEQDENLVITKGVKNLKDYKYGEGHAGQPHIRAARKAIDMGHMNMHDISYVFTKEDVAPILREGDLAKADIDYERYWNRQVMAICEPIIISAQIGEGTYIPPNRNKYGRKLKTHSHSLMDWVSS